MNHPVESEPTGNSRHLLDDEAASALAAFLLDSLEDERTEPDRPSSGSIELADCGEALADLLIEPPQAPEPLVEPTPEALDGAAPVETAATETRVVSTPHPTPVFMEPPAADFVERVATRTTVVGPPGPSLRWSTPAVTVPDEDQDVEVDLIELDLTTAPPPLHRQAEPVRVDNGVFDNDPSAPPPVDSTADIGFAIPYRVPDFRGTDYRGSDYRGSDYRGVDEAVAVGSGPAASYLDNQLLDPFAPSARNSAGSRWIIPVVAMAVVTIAALVVYINQNGGSTSQAGALGVITTQPGSGIPRPQAEVGAPGTEPPPATEEVQLDDGELALTEPVAQEPAAQVTTTQRIPSGGPATSFAHVPTEPTSKPDPTEAAAAHVPTEAASTPEPTEPVSKSLATEQADPASTPAPTEPAIVDTTLPAPTVTMAAPTAAVAAGAESEEGSDAGVGQRPDPPPGQSVAEAAKGKRSDGDADTEDDRKPDGEEDGVLVIPGPPEWAPANGLRDGPR